MPDDLDTVDDNLGDGLLDDDLLGGSSDIWGDTAQSPMEKHSDLLKELTNFDPIIASRIRNWLGLEFDDKVQDYIKKRPAIINEKGARWAMGFLQTYQARTNFVTNISHAEFKNLQLDIIKMVWLVFPCIDDFDVKGTPDWYRLCTELDNSAFLVLAGAADGKYTKFLGESVTRTETVNLSPPHAGHAPAQGSGGIIGKMRQKLLGR